MHTSTPSTALTFDVGGTRLKAGLITEDGTILALRRADSPASEAPEQVIQTLLAVGQEVCAQAGVPPGQVKGIGLSIAAFVTADGVVKATAHLSPDWVGYDLRARLLREWDSAFYFALDTPAPTLGEAYFGEGKDLQDFVYLTVSTGIGAGIIANRRYYSGGRGWAGGIGHSIIDEASSRVCEGCGNAGCLETFAATQGILTTARELLEANPGSRIGKLADGDPARLTPKLIFDAAQQGDAAAREVFRQAGHALGIGLTNLIDVLAPTRVIIGGGISQAGDLLLEPARQVVRERAFPPPLRRTEIVTTRLGDLSGLYGAAAMVFHDLHINPEESD